jgi:hypothetical protein
MSDTEDFTKIEEYFNRQRRNLVLSSSILLFCNLTKAKINSVNAGGLSINFQIGNHNFLVYTFLIIIVIYFYFRFKQYSYVYRKVIDKKYYDELLFRINKMAYDYYLEYIEQKIKYEYPTAARIIMQSIRVVSGTGDIIKDGNGNNIFVVEFSAFNSEGRGLNSDHNKHYNIDIDDDLKIRGFKLRCEDGLKTETPWMTEYKFPEYFAYLSLASIILWAVNF